MVVAMKGLMIVTSDLSQIVRAYDIRGKYGIDLFKHHAYFLGLAFVISLATAPLAQVISHHRLKKNPHIYGRLLGANSGRDEDILFYRA